MKKSELKTKAAKALLDAGWDIENVFKVLSETKKDTFFRNADPLVELPGSNFQSFEKYLKEGILQLIESGKLPKNKPINHV